VPLKALRGQRLIGNNYMDLLKGSGLGDEIDAPAMEVTSRLTLMACVKAELGITVVPMLTKPARTLGLPFIPLRAPRVTRTLGVVTRRGQTMCPSVAQIYERALASLRTYAAERTVPGLYRAISSFLPQLSARECANYFRHAGYVSI
jgi:DNA-binding transcriptional LysR family regulator